MINRLKNRNTCCYCNGEFKPPISADFEVVDGGGLFDPDGTMLRAAGLPGQVLGKVSLRTGGQTRVVQVRVHHEVTQLRIRNPNSASNVYKGSGFVQNVYVEAVDGSGIVVRTDGTVSLSLEGGQGDVAAGELKDGVLNLKRLQLRNLGESGELNKATGGTRTLVAEYRGRSVRFPFDIHVGPVAELSLTRDGARGVQIESGRVSKPPLIVALDASGNVVESANDGRVEIFASVNGEPLAMRNNTSVAVQKLHQGRRNLCPETPFTAGSTVTFAYRMGAVEVQETLVIEESAGQSGTLHSTT